MFHGSRRLPAGFVNYKLKMVNEKSKMVEAQNINPAVR